MPIWIIDKKIFSLCDRLDPQSPFLTEACQKSSDSESFKPVRSPFSTTGRSQVVTIQRPGEQFEAFLTAAEDTTAEYRDALKALA